jgi:hypothetical protein
MELIQGSLGRCKNTSGGRRLSGGMVSLEDQNYLQSSTKYPNIKYGKSIILVPSLHKFGSGPTYMAASGSVILVPSILTPLDRGG